MLPFVESVNHGFYYFHANLFVVLALVNGNRVLTTSVAIRDGHARRAAGVPREPDDDADFDSPIQARRGGRGSRGTVRPSP